MNVKEAFLNQLMALKQQCDTNLTKSQSRYKSDYDSRVRSKAMPEVGSYVYSVEYTPIHVMKQVTGNVDSNYDLKQQDHIGSYVQTQVIKRLLFKGEEKKIEYHSMHGCPGGHQVPSHYQAATCKRITRSYAGAYPAVCRHMHKMARAMCAPA